MKLVFIIAEIILSVALTVIVMLQSGKEEGLSAALTGGNSNSYLNNSKYGSMDKILTAATKWVALVWIVVTLALSVIPF